MKAASLLYAPPLYKPKALGGSMPLSRGIWRKNIPESYGYSHRVFKRPHPRPSLSTGHKVGPLRVGRAEVGVTQEEEE